MSGSLQQGISTAFLNLTMCGDESTVISMQATRTESRPFKISWARVSIATESSMLVGSPNYTPFWLGMSSVDAPGKTSDGSWQAYTVLRIRTKLKGVSPLNNHASISLCRENQLSELCVSTETSAQ
eukprot:GFKZ01016089.1.p4 GENE.GFKZ01016089.1~~GFKZ01016089.1.p4  ORF type:complete len:126 (+),score=6.36 GFKZ01016089.1:688-1065(+)